MRWSSKVRRLYRQKGEDQSSTTVVGESTTNVGSWDAAVRVPPTLSRQLVPEFNVELPTLQSRLISKAAPTPIIANSLERQSTEPRIYNIPIETAEEKWHKKIRESRDSLEYPITGHGCAEPQVAVHCLKQTTELYLKEAFQDGNLSERDRGLSSLIKEHGQKYPETLPLAVIACADVLSVKAALESFRFLIPIDRSYLSYLRAVGVAGQSSTVIGQHQGKIAQILVAILDKPSRAAPEFWDLLVTIPLVTRLDFTPPSIIHQVLDQSGVGQKLGDEVNTYLRDG